MAYLKLK